MYEQTDNIIAKTFEKDTRAVQGDWNAKVSSHAYQIWAGTAGRFYIKETNDTVWRLREVAKNNRLVFANTLNPHKLSTTATWHAPNWHVHSQIDFILTPYRKCARRTYIKVNEQIRRNFPFLIKATEQRCCSLALM